MPKTLILFYSRSGATAALADALAEGARSVRFSEVTMRRLDDSAAASAIDAVPEWKASRTALAARYQTFGHAEELASYDGIILGGGMCAAVRYLLDQAEALRAPGAYANTVGSAFAAVSSEGQREATWPMLTSLGNLGMILVPSGSGQDAAVVAAEQGRRVAEVVSWVTHARSHAHSPTHSH